jgi:hypothetical protein
MDVARVRALERLHRLRDGRRPWDDGAVSEHDGKWRPERRAGGVVRHGIVEGEPGGTLPWPVWAFMQRVFRLFRRGRDGGRGRGRGPQA